MWAPYKCRRFSGLQVWSILVWVKTLPRRKDTRNDLKERIVGASLVREVLQDNFQTIRNASFCSEKEYSHVENQLPIFQWMYHPKVRLCSPQTAQWATSQALQASLSMLNAEVYDSTISERWRKYSSFQGCQEKTCPTLVSRKKLAAWFEKLQLNQLSWWISFGQSGVCQTWCCPLWPNTKYCISAQTHHTKC